MNIDRKIMQFTLIYILGIILGYQLVSFYILLLTGFFLILAVVVIYQEPTRAVIILLAFTLGIVMVGMHNEVDESLRPFENETVEVTGQVKPKLVGKGRYILQLESINKTKLKDKPLLLVQFRKDNEESLAWKDTVRLRGSLKALEIGTNPGEFSEKKYWNKQKVNQKLFVLGPVELLKQDQGVFAKSYYVREKIYNQISRLFPEKQSGIILGVILGDKGSLDEHYYDLFQKMGIAHIFAVSGLHVGCILAAYFLASRFLYFPKILNLVIAMLLLAFYSLITGLSPSVIRASIMGLLVLCATNLLRYKDIYTIISTSALIILLLKPLALFSVSFQLSFITVWGLVYFRPIAQEIFCHFPSKVQKTMSIPVAAQIASLPIVVYYFNLASFIAPLINVLIVGLVSLLVPFLIVTILLSFISPLLVSPLVFFINFLLDGIMVFSDVSMKVFSNSYRYLPSPPIIGILVYYLTLAFFREYKVIKRYLAKKTRIITSVILIVSLLLLIIPINRGMIITFLDVGQGDSCVIQSKGGKKIVIDGGIGHITLFNYLKHIGTNKVDLLVLSHPDADHINGLFKVLESLTVNTLLVPPDAYNNDALKELKSIAKGKKTKIIEGKEGMKINLSNKLELDIIAPNPRHLNALDVNNASLVFTCTYENLKILFTGDVENKGIEKLSPLLKEVEIIKVPHHGSNSSDLSELYDKTQPDMAIVSAGRNNRYNHPHPEIVQKLNKRKIKTLRTDESGAIILKARNDKIISRTTLEN